MCRWIRGCPTTGISFMMADAQPRLWSRKRKLAAREFSGPIRILLDSDWGVIAQESKERLDQKLVRSHWHM